MISFILSNDKEYYCTIKKSSQAKRVLLKRSRVGELVLVVPNSARISQKELKSLLLTQENWILSTEKPSLDIPTSIAFPSLSEEWTIKYLTTGAEKARLRTNDNFQVTIEGASSLEEVAKLLQNFSLKKAKVFLPERVKFCYEKYGFSDDGEKIKIALLKSRWGSYSTNNVLTLNARLLFFPLELVDYVIVHELCHRFQHNHSKEFYKLLVEKLPNYKELEKKIKNFQLSGIIWL